MNGTALPRMDTGVVWQLGGEAQVTWQVLNNHGGGYSYRLCPAAEPLTEACFRALIRANPEPPFFSRNQNANCIEYPPLAVRSMAEPFFDLCAPRAVQSNTSSTSWPTNRPWSRVTTCW